MCGIAGLVTTRNIAPDRAAVRRATERLAHRGPDGMGIEVFPSACFGHRRLSIIDLAHSTQPWLSAQRKHCLVFNGEIYNYIELRNDLLQRGETPFRTSGDTEVLMRLLLTKGAGCLNKLNGMFAFALWNQESESLFLARDRLGKKPLYYALTKDAFVFASELGALQEFEGVDTDLDPHGINAFFAYQFIPQQHSIFKGVRKLPPGHYLEFRAVRVHVPRYWSPPLPEQEPWDTDGSVEELVSLVDDAVRLRLRSDVPVGAFLSGGVDSAIIASSLARLGADVETFTVGFSSASFDETIEARESANFIGTRHNQQTLGLNLSQDVQACATAFGEPFADPSAIPTWHLCRSARSKVKVALSGDGADELFGGYRRYLAAQWIQRYRRLPTATRRWLIEPLVRRLPESTEYFAGSSTKKAKLFLSMCQRLAEVPNDLLAQTFSLSERKQLFRNDYFSAVQAADHIGQFHLHDLDLPAQLMLTDVQTYLPDDILAKVDRMSMAHGLEVRTPLLDYRVVEFACRLPTTLKIRAKTQKYLLRKAFAPYLPPAVTTRTKHGFSLPVGKALKTELVQLFQERVLDKALPSFLNPGEVHRLWIQHRSEKVDNGFKLWSILMFCLWHETSRQQ